MDAEPNASRLKKRKHLPTREELSNPVCPVSPNDEEAHQSPAQMRVWPKTQERKRCVSDFGQQLSSLRAVRLQRPYSSDPLKMAMRRPPCATCLNTRPTGNSCCRRIGTIGYSSDLRLRRMR